MLEDLQQQADNATVSGRVRNLVVLLAWLPPLMILFAIGVAALGLGYRTARYGELPDLSGVGAALTSDLSLLAIAAAVAGFYWLLSHATFGGDTVKQATETADQAADVLDEHTD